MNAATIVAQLKAERNRLDQAIRALEALDTTGARTSNTPRPSRRRMSAAARKRLSRLLKQRWASGKMGRRKKATKK